jgi:uncharacterized membrane protein HdeD (DUF308 family)
MLALGYLAQNWRTFVLRGAIAILVGLIALFQPGLTLVALVLLVGFWALFDGVMAIAHSFAAAQAHEPWWPLVLIGLLGITTGLITLRWPGVTELALLLIIAYWAILTGLLEIVAAIRLRHEIQGEWWLILGGIASVVFGVVLLISPVSGALAVIWLIGVYAIFFGVTLVMLGFRLRSIAGQSPAPAR